MTIWCLRNAYRSMNSVDAGLDAHGMNIVRRIEAKTDFADFATFGRVEHAAPEGSSPFTTATGSRCLLLGQNLL